MFVDFKNIINNEWYFYESFKELTHGLKIELIWAVKDNALHGKSFCQVFGSLSFSGACGSFGGSPVIEMVGSDQGPVTPVCQGGDDQSKVIKYTWWSCRDTRSRSCRSRWCTWLGRKCGPSSLRRSTSAKRARRIRSRILCRPARSTAPRLCCARL